MLAGSTVDVKNWHHLANNLLYSSYSGMLGNLALIDIILGYVNPSGKLTETWAENLSDYSSHSIGEFPGGKEVHYREDVFVGYRHFIKEDIKPIFEFGHGLTYSNFKLENFNHNQTKDEIIVNFDISNDSNNQGMEVIQLYVSNKEYTDNLPILKAFNKIEVKANEKVNTSVVLKLKELEFYNEELNNMEIKTGEFEISIGNSINNIFHNFKITI